MTIKDELNCLREAVKIVNEQPFRKLEDNWSEPKHPPKVSKPEHIFVSNSHLSDRSEELGEEPEEVLKTVISQMISIYSFKMLSSQEKFTI